MSAAYAELVKANRRFLQGQNYSFRIKASGEPDTTNRGLSFKASPSYTEFRRCQRKFGKGRLDSLR